MKSYDEEKIDGWLNKESTKVKQRDTVASVVGEWWADNIKDLSNAQKLNVQNSVYTNVVERLQDRDYPVCLFMGVGTGPDIGLCRALEQAQLPKYKYPKNLHTIIQIEEDCVKLLRNHDVIYLYVNLKHINKAMEDYKSSFEHNRARYAMHHSSPMVDSEMLKKNMDDAVAGFNSFKALKDELEMKGFTNKISQEGFTIA